MKGIATGNRLIILRLLMSGKEMNGGDIKEAEPALPRGSIYPVLQELENDGFVSSRHEDKNPRFSGPPRRFFKITAEGRRACRAGEAGMAVLSGRRVRIDKSAGVMVGVLVALLTAAGAASAGDVKDLGGYAEYQDVGGYDAGGLAARKGGDTSFDLGKGDSSFDFKRSTARFGGKDVSFGGLDTYAPKATLDTYAPKRLPAYDAVYVPDTVVSYAPDTTAEGAAVQPDSGTFGGDSGFFGDPAEVRGDELGHYGWSLLSPDSPLARARRDVAAALAGLALLVLVVAWRNGLLREALRYPSVLLGLLLGGASGARTYRDLLADMLFEIYEARERGEHGKVLALRVEHLWACVRMSGGVVRCAVREVWHGLSKSA